MKPLDGRVTIDRSKVRISMRELITALHEKRVQTRAVWGLIHEQLPYQEAIAYEMEKAPGYRECILNIPCSTRITEEEIKKQLALLPYSDGF